MPHCLFNRAIPWQCSFKLANQLMDMLQNDYRFGYMAVSLGYGVLFATGISLILIPCGYMILDDIQRILGIRRPSDELQPERRVVE